MWSNIDRRTRTPINHSCAPLHRGENTIDKQPIIYTCKETLTTHCTLSDLDCYRAFLLRRRPDHHPLLDDGIEMLARPLDVAFALGKAMPRDVFFLNLLLGEHLSCFTSSFRGVAAAAGISEFTNQACKSWRVSCAVWNGNRICFEFGSRYVYWIAYRIGEWVIPNRPYE